MNARPAPLRCWAVVPAAGRGERFGSNVPKQYLPLAGATVLEHAVRPFIGHRSIAGIVVVLAPGDERWATTACATATGVITAVGGERRMDSVLSGRNALAARADAAGGAPVHDAARPGLTGADVDRLIDVLAQHAVGGLLAVPSPDTVKRATPDGRASTGSVERAGLWRAQTPQ